MRRHWWSGSLVSLWLVGLLPASAVAVTVSAAQEPAEQTIQGEVVDPALYIREERHGPAVEEETYEAVDGGQTLAILEEGTGILYLLLAEAPGEDPNELAYEHIAKPVKVTGRVFERGGLRGIVPTQVMPIEPANATSPTP